MDVDIDQLPQTAAEISEIVGIDAALRLVDAWGGVRIYVPRQIPDDHLLISTLGREEAELLAEHYGGETILIPRCLAALRAVRNARICRERSEGHGIAVLALRYRLTERQVYAVLAASDAVADDRQQSLF
ncbi:MAG: hypothetical protein CMO06_09690 [Thalassospira sp.]|jgi:hypothetical protein|uniref:Mor transcription activator family protein n=1 Tax=Thalassospira sp. TaxID=1912094 RepID=UPI000C5C6CF6|nr:Mor transcription activator family protein [Thalassospira sp.]MAZ33403.1 hypothetical protein [Thalassospira sp.]